MKKRNHHIFPGFSAEVFKHETTNRPVIMPNIVMIIRSAMKGWSGVLLISKQNNDAKTGHRDV